MRNNPSAQYSHELPMTPEEKARGRRGRRTRRQKRVKRRHQQAKQALSVRTATPFTWKPLPGRPGLFERIH